MFVFKLDVPPQDVNTGSKTALLLARSHHGTSLYIDIIPDEGILLYVLDNGAQVLKAFEYKSMRDVWLSCLQLVCMPDEWQIQPEAWFQTFDAYYQELSAQN